MLQQKHFFSKTFQVLLIIEIFLGVYCICKVTTVGRLFPLCLQLERLEQGVLDLNPFISVRLAQQLQTATNHSSKLYGNDIYIAQQLVSRILEHDSNANGFNLTHRHDKNFIKV